MPFSVDSLNSLFAPVGADLFPYPGRRAFLGRLSYPLHTYFLFRMWRMARGGVEVKDQQIQQYLEKQNSFVQAQFLLEISIERAVIVTDLVERRCNHRGIGARQHFPCFRRKLLIASIADLRGGSVLRAPMALARLA